MGKTNQLHIAMFPWLAFGHLIPYLELAKLIAQKGHKISFISTPRNIDRLPKLPENLAASIKFVKLTFPREENLPEDAESTLDIPYSKVSYLKMAFDGLKDPLAQFLEASSPDWIIYDFASHWLPEIAAKLGISLAFFFIFNAWTVCFFGSKSIMINGTDPRTKPEHFTVPPEWVPFPSKVVYRLHEANKAFEDSIEVNNSGISDVCRLGLAISGCDVFIPRSCFELESDWLKLLEELNEKPVIPSGLLPPSNSYQVTGESPDSTWITINEWLTKQKIGLVVYVALGSEVTLSQEQLTELAQGLELSGLPFFWVLRNLQNLKLPDGFEERIKGRGIVWTTWAPQIRILAHDSVGGFLTHCGWSSIIEGLSFGRALIMLPIQIDQGLNARVFEEKMVGKEIPRDETSGSFTRDMVAQTLKLVITEDEGRIRKEKAREIMKIFADNNQHQRYVDSLVEYLENYKNVSDRV